MKEKIRRFKTIIIIILIVLLIGCLSVYAASVTYKYHSIAVKYTSDKSVKDALDELYQLYYDDSQKSRVYYLGTGTSFNLKEKFPDKYENLTGANFIVGTVGASQTIAKYTANGSYRYATGGYTGFQLAKSYNNTTGILTITGNGFTVWTFIDSYFSGGVGTADARTGGTVTPFAYVVLGDISE